MRSETIRTRFADISLMFPIFGSHVRRIGWIRTLVGGFSMYLCIPGLVLVHHTLGVLAYQWLVRPVFGTARLRWADHVIIDRHRITELPYFDRFNCMFCGYANGLCVMANREIDQIGALDGRFGFWRQVFLLLLSVLMLPIVVFYELSYQLIYNLLVSRPLGMHRVSIAEANAVLEKDGYAAGLPPLARFLIRVAKIESSFCPLRHFEEREGIVYPDHHKKFFGPDQIEAMRQTLITVGTVSDKTPTW
ncbi:MAG: hypothetical protein ACE5FC_02585 [Myxococcota bacterium]